MNKAIPTDQTPANITKVLELLIQAPVRLDAVRQSTPVERLRQPLGKGERTPTEVLAHMLHSEARSAEAMYLALLIDEPLIANLHSERDWGKLLRFDALEFSELLAYFKTRRKVLLRVLSELPEKDWARVVREDGKKRKESIYWRARTIAMHESEHLAELESRTPQK